MNVTEEKIQSCQIRDENAAGITRRRRELITRALIYLYAI